MTTTDQPTSLGSGTVAALESAWADVRELNPDVAEHVVFRIGSGAAGRRGGLVMGSITIDEIWVDNRKTSSRAASDPSSYREVFIAGETLAQHPVRLMQTLIHEAVHSVAFTRGVKDTSRQYRYHNRKFRAIAEEMGLEWTHLGYVEQKDADGVRRTVANPAFDPAEPADIRNNPRFLTCEAKADEVIGFSDMDISKATATLYRDTIQNLDARVSVQLGGQRTFNSAPKRRRTVLLCTTGEDHGLTDDAELFHDLVDSEEDVQRIGVVVYQGLVERNLLAPHIALIEEV